MPFVPKIFEKLPEWMRKIELCDKGIIYDGGLVRIKQCRNGIFTYLSTDFYIGFSLDRYGEFSELEAKFFRQVIRPGDVVIDVGANIGAHTIVFAQSVGPNGAVVAFEPQRFINYLLCANLCLNSLQNVIVHRKAVGSEKCLLKMPHIDYCCLYNFGGVHMLDGENAEGEPVGCITIDSLDIPACNFIKVDVEGYEHAVLKGAENTIKKFRPILYVEVDYNPEEDKKIIEFLFNLDYRVFEANVPLYNPDNFFGNKVDSFHSGEGNLGGVVSKNVACFPRERNVVIDSLEYTPENYLNHLT